MPEFTAVEARLNKEPESFLRDPVAVLKQEGIQLTPEEGEQLRAQVKEVFSPAGAVPARPKINIGIGIRVFASTE